MLDPQYLDAIKGSEGYAAQPAWDYKQNSSGYGTKAQPGDESIPPDQLKAVHEQRYADEIAKAEAHVDSVNPNLPPGPRAALTSLTYNAGPGWAQSGLGEMVRNGDLQGAAQRFLQYNKAGGEINPALVARRQREASWFNQAPQQVAQNAPASPAANPAAPLQASPSTPPVFAQPQQPQQQGGGSFFGQMPAEQTAQPPPIFAPPRKPIDLSRLKAALQASGNRGLFFGQG